MRRSWTFLAVLFLLLLDAGHAVAAMPATASQAAPLDLAALQLQPRDVDEPHPLSRGGAQGTISEFSGHWADDLRAARYVGSHLLIINPGGDDPDYQINSTIYEFEDTKGAAAGYKTLAYSTYEDDEADRVGDASTIYEAPGTDPYNPKRKLEQLSIMFRQGRLVGEVKISYFGGDKPAQPKGRTLARKLAVRLKAGQAGNVESPGFGYQALQLAVSTDITTDSTYWMLDGKTLHQVLPAKGDPTLAQRFAGATDYFLAAQYANDQYASPFYDARLANFPSAHVAAKWVKTYLAVAQEGTAGWKNVKEIANARDFGDQSHTATFTAPYTGAKGEKIYGTLIVARFGAVGVEIEVKAFKPVPVSVVEGLMTRQARCLASSSRCAQIRVPAALDDLTTSAAPAGNLAWQEVAGMGAAWRRWLTS